MAATLVRTHSTWGVTDATTAASWSEADETSASVPSLTSDFLAPLAELALSSECGRALP